VLSRRAGIGQRPEGGFANPEIILEPKHRVGGAGADAPGSIPDIRPVVADETAGVSPAAGGGTHQEAFAIGRVAEERAVRGTIVEDLRDGTESELGFRVVADRWKTREIAA